MRGEAVLRLHGIRISQARLKTLQVMKSLQALGGSLSAKKVYLELQARGESLGYSTVWSNFNYLRSKGVLAGGQRQDSSS